MKWTPEWKTNRQKVGNKRNRDATPTPRFEDLKMFHAISRLDFMQTHEWRKPGKRQRKKKKEKELKETETKSPSRGWRS
jgi:hypothetical protein